MKNNHTRYRNIRVFLLVGCLNLVLLSCFTSKKQDQEPEKTTKQEKGPEKTELNSDITDEMIQKAEKAGANFLADQLKKLKKETSKGKISYIDDKDPKTNHTALSQAATELKDLAIVKLLLDRGANPNEFTEAVGNILSHMVFMLTDPSKVSAQIPLFQLLLDKGADPLARAVKHSSPCSLEELFSKKGPDFEPLLRLFIAKIGNVNQQEPPSNNTPLHWAVRAENELAVRLLVGRGANPDIANNDTPPQTAKNIANSKVATKSGILNWFVVP